MTSKQTSILVLHQKILQNYNMYNNEQSLMLLTDVLDDMATVAS